MSNHFPLHANNPFVLADVSNFVFSQMSILYNMIFVTFVFVVILTVIAVIFFATMRSTICKKDVIVAKLAKIKLYYTISYAKSLTRWGTLG